MTYRTSLALKRTSRISEYLKTRLSSENILSESTISNIDNCGRGYIALICKENPSHKIKIIKKSCNWKYCPNCSQKVGLKHLFKLREIISEFKTKRMFTLDFVNTRNFSRDIVNKFLRQYSNLMRRLKKKGFVDNYVRVIEVKKNGLTFNMHIHIVYDGRYIPLDSLSQWFDQVTKGESYIVDIRKIGNRENHTKTYVADYLSKYLTKPPEIYPIEAYFDFYVSLKNVRMFQSSLRIRKEKYKACCPVCQGDVEVIQYDDISRVNELIQIWRDFYGIQEG